MRRTYKIEGIVIKRRNFGETDKIISIFSKKYGKIQTIAKGIRKINSRKASHLELFSKIKASLHYGRTWDYLNEVESLNIFPNIALDIDKIAYAFQIVETVDRLCVENEENIGVFSLLEKTLLDLNESKIELLQILIDEFNNNLLICLGYLPKDKKFKGIMLDNYLEKIMEKMEKKGLKKKAAIFCVPKKGVIHF